MLTRKNTIALMLAVVAAPAAFAQADAVWVGGEIGWASRQVQGTLTRAQVQAEFERFRANPMLADGSTYVGGERGYLEHRHTYDVRDGVMVHKPPFTATMGINAASPYERSQVRPGREPWEVMPY
ncbi:hypothetical protein GCM10028796_05180 [Ramlibacter monticola]|uniref:DUF4148 domain-containing protein n=1 Tax=Ramlibacter monticola TaxID=1926872 RepID=A0A937CT22_9BURK|nr:DUF4148 domain-containing protein [Ramlibacter monticola]MBL0391204.1 DUF4148 domain-containing protein [Ramlibacter monticola]